MEVQLLRRSILALAAFGYRVAHAPLDDREAFRTAIVDAQVLLNASQEDIADWFGTSRATVNRWATGAAAPYPGLRRVIFKQLARRATEAQRRKQRRLESETTATLVGKNGTYDHLSFPLDTSTEPDITETAWDEGEDWSNNPVQDKSSSDTATSESTLMLFDSVVNG